MIKADPVLWSAIAGVFIPLIVGAITRWHASRGVKSTVNAVLSATAGVVSVAATNGSLDWRNLVASIAAAFATSISTYYGAWDPTGVAKKIAAAVPGLIGAKEPAAPTVQYDGAKGQPLPVEPVVEVPVVDVPVVEAPAEQTSVPADPTPTATDTSAPDTISAPAWALEGADA